MKTAARLTTDFLPDGGYRFEDRLAIVGSVSARIVTCTAWLLELYQLETGELVFERGDAEVRPASSCFGALFPPFSIARMRLDRAYGRVVGLAAIEPLSAALAGTPTLFETNETDISAVAAVARIVQSGAHAQSIDANPAASALSQRARKSIAAGYLSGSSIASVAARLRVTAAHLSRQFKRDYQMTPREYLHLLRMADAPLKLARGEPIAAVSGDVGYNDLTRFYKQFRKATRTSPGVCQTMIAPAARSRIT